MLYILVPLIILISLVRRKSNWIFFGTLLIIWILLGWSSGNADYNIHIGRFINFESNAVFTETAYTALMRFANKLGLTYQQFLPIMMLFCTAVIGFLSRRMSKAPAFVLALYLIFPACMDAVQIRYFLANCLVLLGFNYLLHDGISRERGVIIYSLCVIIAAFIHVSTVTFLFFIPVRYFDHKKTIIYTAVIAGVTYLSQAHLFIRLLERLPGMGEKINRVLTIAANMYTRKTILKTDFRVIVFFVLFMCVLFVARKRLREKNITEGNEFLDNVEKLNIMSLIILPLITYSVDFYRIQQTLSLLNYCALSYFFLSIDCNQKRKRFVISKKAFVYDVACALITFVNLYYLVLNSDNVNTVFKPFFENNVFFGG